MQKDHLDHVAMTTGGVSGVRVIKEMCRATFRDSQYKQGDMGKCKHKFDIFTINFCSFPHASCCNLTIGELMF